MSVKELLARVISLLNVNYGTGLNKSRLNKELRILDKEFSETEGKLVLDAGSGADESYSTAFVSRGLKAIRLDISIENLNSARKNSDGNNVYFLTGDVNHIPLGNESVDIVFMCEVLEHLNIPEQAVKEAFRVLKKGGLFFIDVPWLLQAYHPLSVLILRNLISFKQRGTPLLLKMLYRNLNEIAKLEDSTQLQRRRFGSFMIKLIQSDQPFSNTTTNPELFIYNYFHGIVPEGNNHLQFRFPKEWVETVRSGGFKLVKETGTFITPPLFNRLNLCNFLFSKLEYRMGDNLALPLSRILIIVAIKS
jgi:ubiquinone/menaquinone biosynthesis C-methylase UbiE